MEPVAKPQVVGTIQYIEWLILTDRVQPSFIAGVCREERISTVYPHTVCMGCHSGSPVCGSASCGAGTLAVSINCADSYPVVLTFSHVLPTASVLKLLANVIQRIPRVGVKCTVSPYKHSTCTVHLRVDIWCIFR